MSQLLDTFETEKNCEYRGDLYNIRDNGAIFRFRRKGKRKRPLDEVWTFGKPDKDKGYLNFSSQTVHRIVATAFHGEQPSEKHIVDHIDTNKKNNRPENLRWITRLENILINPITLSRILFRYGSIDNFLADPGKPINGELEQNFEWMRTVSKEEAENTKRNLLKWAKDGKLSASKGLGDWVHSNFKRTDIQVTTEDPFTISLTKNAVQKNWKTPSEFPNCPIAMLENSLKQYRQKLTEGAIFSKNRYGQSIVEESEINTSSKELFVLTQSDGAKPYALAKVYVDNGLFIHETIRAFFTLKGGQKQFNLSLGQEWNGEDSIDDYS